MKTPQLIWLSLIWNKCSPFKIPCTHINNLQNLKSDLFRLIYLCKYLLKTLHLCILQTLLSKATYRFRLYMFFFLSVCVFPGNRTHDLCTANAMLYHWATGTQENLLQTPLHFSENINNLSQERSQKGDSGCASEKLGVPHLLSD